MGNQSPKPRSFSTDPEAPISQLTPTERQREAFEAAMNLFHARNFASALPLFESASGGPSRDIMHVARQHANMCRQRMPADAALPNQPEDLYHLGLSLIAQRRLTHAEEALQRALQLAPKADHVMYALCLCHGLSGDLEGARRYLAHALELNPKTRTIARTDPDFLEFGRQASIRDLVFGERPRTAILEEQPEP